MAESFDYLDEEIDLSGDLLPCEFCDSLFPSSILIEHSSGCNPDLFLGMEEPDPVHQLLQEHIADTVPVVKPHIDPIPQVGSLQWDEKVLIPKPKSGPSIMIEQLVRNDIYDIKPKDGGGSVMKKLCNRNIANEKTTPNVENEKTPSTKNEKVMNNDTSNSYIHFKTDLNEQGESDSGDDDEPLKDGRGQGGSTQGLDVENSVDLSDDNNEGNETIESFLLQASLELSKIKVNLERNKAKLKESQYARYDAEEEEEYRQYESKNIYYQNCY